MNRNSARVRRIRAVVVCSALLTAPTPGFCQSDSPSPAPNAEARESAVIIQAKYTRGEYNGAVIPVGGVHVERVTDLRGGDPTLVGATEVGKLKYRRVSLKLSVPVADFVQKSFDVLLPADPAEAAPVRVALAIERFELDCQHSWMGPRNATFRARMAVTVLADSGETPSGWLEADEEWPGGTSKGGQERLMYRGMVGMAQGFGRLDLAPTAAGGAGAGGSDGTAGRPTVTSRYQSAWQLGTTRWAGIHFIHYGLTGDEMKDSYGHIQGFTFGGGTWLKRGRSGFGGDLGFISGKGQAKVLDPSWSVTKRELSMWAIPASATYYFRLLSPTKTTSVTPYVGAGVGGWLGVDNLEIDASRGGEFLAGHHRAFRAGWEGHALVGTEIRVIEDFGLLLEAQWTQAGKAALASGVDDKNAEEVLFWDTMHAILERPDNNLTGWRITAGLRWAGPF